MSNWIPDINRFQLAGPPKWFLKLLWEFDSSLVIIPSRMGHYYRLAQRRKMQLAENIVNDILKEQADTAMLASYGLVPVTTILSTVCWSPLLLAELHNRAPWRQGGAAEVIKRLEDQEYQDKVDAFLKQDEKNDYVARDAWRYYQKNIGLRSHVYSPKTPDRRPKHPGLRKVSKTQAYKPDVFSTYIK